uniref:Uncharacterized protein n=1 Tax=Solanum tuberosum TaxID=4113 RepID=M1DDQ3_SOLTU
MNLGIFNNGILIEEQSKDTNKQIGTKQAEDIKKDEPEDHQEHLACQRVVNLTSQSSIVPNLDGRNQVGDEKEQSVNHREVPRRGQKAAHRVVR